MDLTEILKGILTSASASMPWLVGVFALVGVARAVNKPLFALLHAFAESTETKSDDELLAKVEGSAIKKGFDWVLDLLFSVKIGSQKPKA